MAGAVGTLLVTLVVLWLAASSILSILLFNAGWKTLRDDPAGIRVHRLWAWISLALDIIALIGSGGTAPNSWTGVVPTPSPSSTSPACPRSGPTSGEVDPREAVKPEAGRLARRPGLSSSSPAFKDHHRSIRPGIEGA